MHALMSYALTGLVHIENRLMLKMASELGFRAHQAPGDPTVREVVWRPPAVSDNAGSPQVCAQKRVAE
jgi:hypothetical protein